jgi:hypothetical protein
MGYTLLCDRLEQNFHSFILLKRDLVNYSCFRLLEIALKVQSGSYQLANCNP